MQYPEMLKYLLLFHRIITVVCIYEFIQSYSIILDKIKQQTVWFALMSLNYWWNCLAADKTDAEPMIYICFFVIGM